MDLVMVALTDRTVDNINSEVNVALDTMGIEQCVLLVHSISGVYGLNFVQNYPEKVKGFIAVDNTVYDEELAEAMEMEKKYMLQGIDEFQKIKNSFSSLEEFQTALKTDPDKYGQHYHRFPGILIRKVIGRNTFRHIL